MNFSKLNSILMMSNVIKGSTIRIISYHSMVISTTSIISSYICSAICPASMVCEDAQLCDPPITISLGCRPSREGKGPLRGLGTPQITAPRHQIRHGLNKVSFVSLKYFTLDNSCNDQFSSTQQTNIKALSTCLCVITFHLFEVDICATWTPAASLPG